MKLLPALLRKTGSGAAYLSLTIAVFAGTSETKAWAQSVPSLPQLPETDSFYHQPDEAVAAAQLGEILASRPVTLENLLSNPGRPWDVDAWQLAYRSNNTKGQPITAVATVIKPRGTASAPRKLFSASMPENSTAGYCAPSYALRYGAAIPTTAVGQLTIPLQTRFVQAAIDRGMAVVVPDDEGPNSAYSAGQLAANITLDGIRAATHFAPLESEPGAPVGLIGYSGGATGVSRAAEKAASYAPELNIVAAAMGGVLVDVGSSLSDESGTIATGLALASVMGVASEYPELDDYLQENATPDIRLLMRVKKPFCTGWQASILPFLNLNQGLNIQGSAVSQQVLDNENLGKTVPKVPLFIWQSRQDEFFNVKYTDQLVNYYCSDPQANVEYLRDGVPGHIITGLDGGSTAVRWLVDRINGVPLNQGCSIRDVDSLGGL